MANTKNVPLAALQFAADLELGSNGEGAKTVPVKLKARSGQPVDHWYFGRIVHDMAGMSLSKSRLPIDYCHNESEVMGFANKFETEGQLVASGALTPFADGDRASEVIFKSREGVPYEASIFFDPAELVLEFVPQGMAVPVNGFSFEGPGVVARKWTLRGLAVCPYGQDKNTNVEFSAGKTPEVAVRFSETTPPSEEAAPAAVESEAVNDSPAAEAQPAVDAATTEDQLAPAAAPVEVVKLGANDLDGQAFLTAFGDQGGVWFAQGKKFAECQVLFAQQLAADRERLTKENQELRTQLSAIRGEREPVSFGGDAEVTTVEPTTKQMAALGPGLARFAANLRFARTGK
jgi:hypothetical protein